MSSIIYGGAVAADLPQILAIQRDNVAERLSAAEVREQGFVTVQHDLALLTEMNAPYAHTVARVDGRVVGYALVMRREFAPRIAVLLPMFERIDGLLWQGQPIGEIDYFVMGQVAIAKAYRGQGIFDGLYENLVHRLLPPYALMVTEIATRNTRSRRAHARVGFVDLLVYKDADGEEWAVVGLYHDF